VRSHGFGSDWVRGFQLVTGGGELVRASAEENPELFWALSGGKGGLGVVTEVTIELVPLGTIYGGSLVFDGPDIRTALAEWVRYLDSVDSDVSTSVAIMRLPDLPFIPERLRARTLLSIRFAYPGTTADGERLAAPLRGAAPVYIDSLAEMSVANMDSIHADPTAPTAGWTRSRALGTIDQKLIDALLEHADAGRDFPFVSLEIRHLGAAASSDVPGGSAVSGREAGGMVTLVGVPNPALFDTVIPGVADAVWEAIGPWLDPQNNVNFAMPFATQHAYEAVWPADTFARLATVRRKYDPDGTFVFGF
jgi:FAD/FMN-containing dehydrogenase